MRNTPGASDAYTLFCYHPDHKLLNSAQCTMLDHLHNAAFCIGEEKLGFKPVEIGSKSIRSGACVDWFIDHHLVKHANIMGRWESESLLVCIRKEVMEFCKCTCKIMMCCDFYHGLPTFSSSNINNHSMASPASSFNYSLSMPTSFPHQY